MNILQKMIFTEEEEETGFENHTFWEGHQF